MAGYSKTPLLKKLGIKENFKLRLLFPPSNYLDLLGSLPNNVQILEDNSHLIDFVHLFAKDTNTLHKHLPILRHEIVKNGMIWVSWYKKASKIPTDLNENIIRDTALNMGLVDIKVCAVDNKWSGLKLVIRKENR